MSIESNDKTRESYVVNPVGYIRSKYHHFDDVPHPHGDKGWGEDTSRIILCPEHAEDSQIRRVDDAGEIPQTRACEGVCYQDAG
jgi:hypothetical protein